MTASSHQAALKTKHENLDVEIQAELQRPLPDSVHIRSLKKQKLKLKEAYSQYSTEAEARLK